MLGNYFYNATIKRIVSVFGTIFNNIKISRFESGVATNTIHVPISYGPRSKFLTRINEDANLSANKVAIKMPRMSFEMTSIDYDAAAKLNKLNQTLQPVSGSNDSQMTRLYQSVPYSIGMQLNIFAKNQDDALQIVEQILPTFSPEYTVTIKGIDGPSAKTDVPFILNSVSFQDDYEGDFNSRRTIIYTLDFSIKAKFAPGTGLAKIIKRASVALRQFDSIGNVSGDSPGTSLLSQVTASGDSPEAVNASPSGIKTFVSFINPSDTYTLTFNTEPGFEVGETIIGSTSLVAGTILSLSTNTARVSNLEGLFTTSETIIGQNSPDSPSRLKTVTLSSIVKS